MEPVRILTLFGEEILLPVRKEAAEPGGGRTGSRPRNGAVPLSELPLADWEPVKQYHTIGEVAALFATAASNIRFWSKEFALKIRTTKKGDRLYTASNIAELRIIYHLLRERGFTIAGARARMKEDKLYPPAASALELRTALLRLRNELVSIRNGLE